MATGPLQLSPGLRAESATNCGTKYIVKHMVERSSGRIWITSSIAGTMPTPYEAVYGATKAFERSQSLREELKDTGVNKVPFGPLMNKGLTVKTGQTHVHRYLQPLLNRIQSREIDPSFVVTHRVKLEDGPAMYKTFRDKEDGCIKVVLKPHAMA